MFCDCIHSNVVTKISISKRNGITNLLFKIFILKVFLIIGNINNKYISKSLKFQNCLNYFSAIPPMVNLWNINLFLD